MTQPLGNYPNHDPYDDDAWGHVGNENCPADHNDQTRQFAAQPKTYTRYSNQSKEEGDKEQGNHQLPYYPSSTPYVKSDADYTPEPSPTSDSTPATPNNTRTTPPYNSDQLREAHQRGYVNQGNFTSRREWEERKGHNSVHHGESNWPSFLKEKGNQLFFSFVSLMLTLSLGAGIVLPIYYLFVLDGSVEKDNVSKVINWVAFIVPLVLVFLLFITMIVAAAMGFDAGRPQLPYPYGKIY